MPVRGTSAWQHARVTKKIINRDEGGWGRVTTSGTHYVLCAWLDCMNDATTLYQVRTHLHNKGYEEKYMIYSFCSDRCKQKWLEDTWRNRVLSCRLDIVRYRMAH